MLTLLAIFLSSIPAIIARQSVFSCPLSPGLSGLPGVIPGYAGIGEVCGSGSFLHYWICCEDYPFECCFQFETWAIVLFAVVLVLLVGAGLFALGRLIATRY
ncbi:unnamed protein product [Bursaphelenchus xylophilus]|uniref:(pine wood nematode) hypothetical protein n=1 Tax=Bursaphelenchus xylophilus TaxID=6326 RepID=A0A1I7RLQ6_BURXY|nr:unnamed protein product [Bursaphelenchus xylophilus]CAG9082695.1 unnamed protein product [Bursaphelenchus xylophilus]